MFFSEKNMIFEINKISTILTGTFIMIFGKKNIHDINTYSYPPRRLEDQTSFPCKAIHNLTRVRLLASN